MSAHKYTVQYDIDFRANDAIKAANDFRQAISKMMTGIPADLQKLEKEIKDFWVNVDKKRTLRIDVSQVLRDLKYVTKELNRVDSALNRLGSRTVNANIGITRGGGGGGGGGGSRTQIVTGQPLRGMYRGQDGAVAVNTAKGMGLAMGVAELGGLFGDVIGESVRYDNLIASVRGILGAKVSKDEESQRQFLSDFRRMEMRVRDVGRQTKFTAPQVADAAKFLAMAGYDARGINSSIRAIADIALIGDTDLAETADVVTNIMTAYGIDPGRMQAAADIMTSTFTGSNVDLMQMAESFKYSAGLLSLAGVDFQEAAAAIGILGDAGIHGSSAGTALRSIIGNLNKPTKAQRKAWDDLFGAENSMEKITRDKNGNMRSLVDIFSDMSSRGMNVADFYKMYNKTAAQAAAALTMHVEKWDQLTADNFMSAGLARNQSDIKKNTVEGLWYQLSSAFTEVALREFESRQGSIQAFLIDITNYVNSAEFASMISGIGDFLMNLIKWIKELVSMASAFYKEFKPVVDLFVQWQMMAALVKVPISALSMLGSAFGSYASNVQAAVTAQGNFKTKMGRAFSTAAMTPFSRGLVGAAGGIGAGYLASQAGADEYWSMGAMAGVSMLPHLAGKGGLAGMGIAGILGAIGGGYYLYNSDKDYIKRAASVFNEFFSSMNDYGLAAMNLTEPADLMTANLRIMSSEMGSANDKFERSIRLYRDFSDAIEESPLFRRDVGWGQTEEGRASMQRVDLLMEKNASWFDKLLNDQPQGETAGELWAKASGGRYEIIDSDLSGTAYDAKMLRLYDKNNKLVRWQYLYHPADGSEEELQRSALMTAEFMSQLYNENSNVYSAIKQKIALSYVGAMNREAINNLPDYISKSLIASGGAPKMLTSSSSFADFMAASGELATDAIANATADLAPIIGFFSSPHGDTVGATEYLKHTLLPIFGGEQLGRQSPSDYVKELRERLIKKNEIKGEHGWLDFVDFHWKNYLDMLAKVGQKEAQAEIEKVAKPIFDALFKSAGMEGIPKKIQPAMSRDEDSDGGAGGGLIDGNAKKTVNDMMADYKTKSSGSMEAPKQVIVNIDSLMKVDNIDMTNPDSQAVVSNIKQQLATALIDVVHDFDVTYMQ